MSFRDRLVTANAAARKVADEGRAERQHRRNRLRAGCERVKTDHSERTAVLREPRSEFENPNVAGSTASQPPRSPLSSAQDYQPGGTTPFLTLPFSAAQANRSRRKWPWIVGGTVLLLVVIGAANGEDKSSTSPAPGPAPQTQAPAVPAQVTLPADLVGKNAQLADDELRKLGIANISYASQDAKDKVSLPLANWTVTKVEPAPGAVVSTTDMVLVTATRKAGSIAPQPAPPAPASRAGQQAAPTTPAERVETPSERPTVRPQPVAPQPVAPQRDDDSSGGGAVYYKNCDAARAAGAAPIKSGEPGYRPGLDRDKDGTACDK